MKKKRKQLVLSHYHCTYGRQHGQRWEDWLCLGQLKELFYLRPLPEKIWVVATEEETPESYHLEAPSSVAYITFSDGESKPQSLYLWMYQWVLACNAEGYFYFHIEYEA